jgi:hypothetical protein
MCHTALNNAGVKAIGTSVRPLEKVSWNIQISLAYYEIFHGLCLVALEYNLLVLEFSISMLAHSVCKMWIIHEQKS